jgi:hypothetical protein
MGDISPVMAGTALGKPANMASLEIVWWELEVAIILVKSCLKLVVSVLFVYLHFSYLRRLIVVYL